jgi:cation diffusion facilitator family transporter
MRKEEYRSGIICLWLGLLGNALMIVVKFFLGVVGRSQALFADAVHSLSDFGTDLLAFTGLRYLTKGSDRDHPFGHGKIETLMSMLIGIALIMVGLWIGYQAAESLVLSRPSSPNLYALYGAALSIVVKEWMYQYTVRVGRRIKSQVLVANAWHHRSDALSSIAALIGIGAAVINPAWSFMDAVAALFVALLIVKVGFDITVPAFQAAADAAPTQERIRQITEVAEAVPGVRSAHDIRARSYSNQLYVELHAVVDPSITVSAGHKIADEIRAKIMEKIPDILDVIIHIDPDEGSSALPRGQK